MCILPLSLLFLLECTVMLLLITSVKARLTKNIHVWNLLNSPQNVCNSSSNLLNLQCMKRVATLSLWKCGQLTFFYRCYCGRCSSELTHWLHNMWIEVLGNIRGGGSAPLCQLYKETLKISYSLHYKITTNPMLGYSGAALGLNLMTQYTRTIIYRFCNTTSFILW